MPSWRSWAWVRGTLKVAPLRLVDGLDTLNDPGVSDATGAEVSVLLDPPVVGRGGDAQDPENRLDPEAVTMFGGERHGGRRVGSGRAVFAPALSVSGRLCNEWDDEGVSQEGYREFEVLYMAEYPRVVRTAYLITGDRYEAADLAQEAFALAYRRWDEVSQMERAGGWLQRMVANLSLAWRRRQRQRLRARMVAPSASAQPLAGPDPDLLAALRSLPPAQRVVLVLRFFADQSIDEVARGLKKRPGTVRALTAQGINRLRRQLKEETFYDA